MRERKIFPFGTGREEIKRKLFCFYHAGGSAMVFRNWLNISDAFETVPIDVPDRQKKLETIHFYDEVKKAVTAVAGEAAECEVIFYGHSLGALFAFCAAADLKKTYGMNIKKLIVAGRHAPHKESNSSFRYSDGEDALLKEIKKSGGADDKIIEDDIFKSHFLPIILNGYRLNEEYEYKGEVLGVPIITLSGSRDYDATTEIMSAWSEVTSGEFRQYEFDGTHLFPYGESEPEVLKVIKREIEIL